MNLVKQLLVAAQQLQQAGFHREAKLVDQIIAVAEGDLRQLVYLTKTALFELKDALARPDDEGLGKTIPRQAWTKAVLALTSLIDGMGDSDALASAKKYAMDLHAYLTEQTNDVNRLTEIVNYVLTNLSPLERSITKSSPQPETKEIAPQSNLVMQGDRIGGFTEALPVGAQVSWWNDETSVGQGKVVSPRIVEITSKPTVSIEDLRKLPLTMIG